MPVSVVRPGVTALAALTIAVFAVLLAPTAAHADMYCVNSVAVVCDHNYFFDRTNLEQALSDAATHPGPDTVSIAAGTIDELSLGVSINDTNQLTIVGAGVGKTILRATGNSQSALYANLSNPASRVSNMTLEAYGSATVGFALGFAGPGLASNLDLRVVGPTANQIGASLGDGSRLSDTTIENGSNNGTGINNFSGTLNTNATVTNVTMTGSFANPTSSYGISSDGQAGELLTLDRVTIRGFAKGIGADSGTVHIYNSLLDMGTAPDATALLGDGGSSDSILTVFDHTTIVGSGPTQHGFRVDSNNAMQHNVMQFNNSVMRLTGTTPSSFTCTPFSGTITVSTSYSAFDPTTNSIDPGCAFVQSHNLPNPGSANFVNAAGGNFQLVRGSGLIDHAAPAVTGTGLLVDLLGGVRVVDGDKVAGRRSDIGAYEFHDRVKPASPSHIKATRRGRTSITLSWKAGSDDIRVASYLVYVKPAKGGHWKLVKQPSARKAVIKKLKAAHRYRFRIVTVDEAGNRSAPRTSSAFATTR